MATNKDKETKKEDKKVCDSAEKSCDCGCGCKCCCCGCKGKLLKLFVLIIVFLAGIGCGCLLCCNGCKSHRHMPPAPMAMVKHGMHGPKNNVIVIRTDGDEIVPEVAKMEGNFRNLKRHRPDRPAPAAEPANAATPNENPAPAEAPVEAPAPAEVPGEPVAK